MPELEEFIDEVHNEPYNLFTNNCIHKHAKIVRRARELGHDASVMGCIGVLPRAPLTGLPIVGPHFYAKVDGKTVDVNFEPCLEQVSSRSEDIVKLISINLSKLRPHDPEDGPPVPAFLPKWPWRK